MNEKHSSTLKLPVRGPFSLDPLRSLACGFLRGTRTCDADAVKIAFPEDGSFAVVGAHVSLDRDGAFVTARVTGATNDDAVGRQLARCLALDHDGAAFAALGDEDPVIARELAARPGFRPVVAYSPYVMAGFCVLSQRTPMRVAAALQTKMAYAFGDVAVIDGEEVASFPRPASILGAREFPGISAEKWTRLQAVARAAADGHLDAERLRAMSPEEAVASLREIRGVGAWTAEAVLVRGAGTFDTLALAEPTVHAAVQHAYGLPELPSDDEVLAIAEGWRPFRTWVSVLLVSGHFTMPRGRTRGRARDGTRARTSEGRTA